MTAPIYQSPSASDLGLYMNDDSVYADRATYLIGQSELLCQTVPGCDPLPYGAVVVVVRVAARAYVTITSARQVKTSMMENPYAPVPSAGGVYLTTQDEEDLRNLAGGNSGVFTFDTLPADYTLQVPYWDQGVWPLGFGP